MRDFLNIILRGTQEIMRFFESLVLDIILEIGIGHGFEKLSHIILRHIGLIRDHLIAEITAEVRLYVLNDVHQSLIEEIIDLVEILFILRFP